MKRKTKEKVLLLFIFMQILRRKKNRKGKREYFEQSCEVMVTLKQMEVERREICKRREATPFFSWLSRKSGFHKFQPSALTSYTSPCDTLAANPLATGCPESNDDNRWCWCIR